MVVVLLLIGLGVELILLVWLSTKMASEFAARIAERQVSENWEADARKAREELAAIKTKLKELSR